MREKIVNDNTGKVLPQDETVTILLNRYNANSLANCLARIRTYPQSLKDGVTLHFVIHGFGDEIRGTTPSTYNISQEEIESIGVELANCNQLRGLTLIGWAGDTFNDDALMLNFFNNLPNLNKIAFINCDISEQLGDMKNIVKRNQLFELSFINCSDLTSYEFMESLGKGMKHNSTLERLLINNDLSLFTGGLKRFLDLSQLNTHQALKEFDLGNNDWTTPVIFTNMGYQFHPELLNNYEYNELVNHLHQTTQCIVDLLEKNHTLQSLRLGFQRDSLYISPCILGKSICHDEQIERIAVALSNNTTLTHFSISDLSFKSMQRLADALKFNFTLTHFEIIDSDCSPQWYSKEIMPLLRRNLLIKEGEAILSRVHEYIEKNQELDRFPLEQVFAFSLELMEYKKLGLVNNAYLTRKCEEVIKYFRDQLLDKIFPYTINLFAKQLIYPETLLLPIETTRDTGIELFIEHLLPMDLTLPVTKEENEVIMRDKLQLILLLIRHYQGSSSDVLRIRNHCLIGHQGRTFQPSFATIETILGCDRVLTIAQFLSLLENEYNIRAEEENFKRLMNTTPEESWIEDTLDFNLMGMWIEKIGDTDNDVTQIKPETKIEKIVIYEQVLLDGLPNVINVTFPLSALSQKELIDFIEIYRGMNVHCIEEEKALLRWITKIIEDIQTITVLNQKVIIQCIELIHAFPKLKPEALLGFIIANLSGMGNQSAEEEKAILKLIEIQGNASTNPQQQPSVTDLGMFRNAPGNNSESASNNNQNLGGPPTSPQN